MKKLGLTENKYLKKNHRKQNVNNLFQGLNNPKKTSLDFFVYYYNGKI